MSGADSFKRLVKLAARAFYDDISTKGDNQPKTGRSDNRGMAVVVLDALTRRQWVKEEDLAKDLKLHSKQLRRTLRFFEEEKLVMRDHRRETAKGAKVYNAALAATGDGQLNGNSEEKMKMHTHSYCCLDYAQIYDIVRYRIHRMKKKLKDDMEDKNTIQKYECPNCKRKYSALDALQLISMHDESFHCENCNAELVAESDKKAAEEMGDGDDNARRRMREKLRDQLQRIEVELKPLMDQLARVKDLPAPEFGTLQAWEARAIAAGRAANGDSALNDSSRAAQGQGYGGTPMPFLGETRVEVALSGVEEKEEDLKPDYAATVRKVLPPWMIKQGMNLTNEQRGEVKQEIKTENASIAHPLEEKKPKEGEKQNAQTNIQEEYLKAYYAAILKRQQEEQAAAAYSVASTSNVMNGVSETQTERRVGMKVKREYNEDEDDVEWEDATPSGVSSVAPKINDLNEEADAPKEEDDEDEIDWEEG
ncbi:transcription initiation factor IIE subunit alpha isoform X1 [Amborella trichopoda]|uniref:HTH TFE/IIEalpha-type domain-containing protein n=1 Tax=Amborella trichopoda TaxID=13333 RepID=U5D683_AMBTC|nr:transcription initiation factor IIE subunit alpha isoform X1 [Amborella trichopoda]ERN15868.1 hypothetical protein AMTR_s00039p00190210 [Amborella trichopoda]|eukprot:XP_006854401.1 transcription initiation factor IIE subunit alpha isoform X1 [Amborella trichopoda]